VLVLTNLIGFGVVSEAPIQTLLGPLTGVTDQNNDGYSFRNIIPTSGGSGSITQVRITLTGNTASTSVIDNVSVGVRSGSTANTVAAPVEILFSGGSGVSISAAGTAVSDWTSISFTAATDTLLIVADIASTTGNLRRIDGAGAAYYAAATNSYNVQSPGGFSLDSSNIYLVTKVEGR